MEEPQFQVQVIKEGQVVEEKSFHTKEEAKSYYQATLDECDEKYGTDFDTASVNFTKVYDDGTIGEISVLKQAKNGPSENNDLIRVHWYPLLASSKNKNEHFY